MKVGEVLAGRYELRAQIGSGRGSLFLAHDRRSDHEVAVKVFDTGHVPAEALQRYAAQLAAAAAVNHPAVAVPRVQIATSESPPFVVGELLQGEDLASLCARLRPIPSARALAIAHSCAEGLAALAAATGVAHRALRPGNVWLSASGQAQILDFGIAELGAFPAKPRSDASFVEYRAPEQLEGAPGNARSDVFSLGVLLFEMVTGVHPFSGPSAAAVAIKVLMQPAPAPTQLAPHVHLPPQLAALIARSLARRPKDRIGDPASMAQELAALLPADTSPVHSPETAESEAATPASAARSPGPALEPMPGGGHGKGLSDMPLLPETPLDPASDRTLAIGRSGRVADDRTEVLRPRYRPSREAPVERTEFLPRIERPSREAPVERTEVLRPSERPGPGPDADDERTQTLIRAARPGKESAADVERTLAMPRIDRPLRGSAVAEERTLAVPRGGGTRTDEDTLILPETNTAGEWRERPPLAGGNEHATRIQPLRPPETSPARAPDQGAPPHEHGPASSVPVPAAATGKQRLLLVGLNLVLVALVIAFVLGMWRYD